MKINKEEFEDVTREEAFNLLLIKRTKVKMEKNLLNAERNVYKAVNKFVNNDEMIKLGSWQNIRYSLLEQIDAHLNLAIRYLRTYEIDSIAMSYLKNCINLNKQLHEKNTDEYFVGLKDKYIENAYKYIPEEKLV